nr:immunoglobulin light chain junction region [Macaca mulatta]MOW40582.1 immunoglobulin light chain junction region [Macaca mulatta]MOW40852.1 immunoglobulin light chain junction region [Macaca mulatta]MOW41115.1 immunoglobulin light chain junction region [Macaca mulatta]MOW41147.1 immunoglobulin light chain junction region [Macaca mulatta]
CQQYYSDPNTF